MPHRHRHCLSILGALLALAWPGLGHAAVPAGAAAEILALQGGGDQRAATAAESGWRPARVAQALATGDYVRTHPASKMALLFADDTQLRLAQNSVLQVKGLATPGQPVTTLLLGAGRAWAQTKRADGTRLNLETPAAVAAIRGTDWDIEVGEGGRTLLTVLSGTVEFGNAQGTVSVGTNEAAVAEVGKAPAKLVLSQPRDRIQWVNALMADPLPHLRAQPLPDALRLAAEALQAREPARARAAMAQATAAPPAWSALFEHCVRLQEGDIAGARAGLQALVQQAGAPVAAWLLLSDLQLMDGDSAAAEATLRQGLAHWPRHPALVAQQARAELLAGRLDDSAATLAGAAAQDDVNLALVRGELARRRGDAPLTFAAYTEATQRAPDDSRGWYGLGSAYTEREDTQPAREHLRLALDLAPQAALYQGELGTLEAFANHFDAADAAFAQALEANPADYVALTGLGLLRLKQGRTQEALDAFLRAGVMEPRYARAKTWTAVAYYQLGRHADAVSTLEQAIALDDKDPVPYLLLAQIRTDLFQPGEAVEAARAAVARMPYLKSLNQVANDQKGSANLGASLAFFGMEDWALEVAQQSFYPYWGGSHLFLADRYAGEFNKNSALFQGFLTDPLAFGGSQRYATLLQKPGAHGAVGITAEREFYRLRAPSVTLNGMDNSRVPLSWFLKVQDLRGNGFPIDVGVVNWPAFHDGSGSASVRGYAGTLGLGMEPTERLRLFAYFNTFDLDLSGHNNFGTQLANSVQQGALGASYRWGPTEQTWFKLGRSLEHTTVDAMPTLFANAPVLGVLGLAAEPRKAFTDLQLRHTVDPQPGTRLAVTLEHVAEKQSSLAAAVGAIGVYTPAGAYEDLLAFGGTNAIDRRYTALTLEGQHQWTPAVRLDGALGLQQIRHRVNGDNQYLLVNAGLDETTHAIRHDTERIATPRVGAVFQPRPGATLRVAYQDWVRPLSVSTLTSVETAGIPVEDRLVEAGGRHKRAVVQWGSELGAATFVTARADWLRITNPGTLGVDLRTPSLPFLEDLRNAQMVNLSTADLLEDTPSFERATLHNLALGVNHMFSRRWSAYGKYLYQHSDSRYGEGDAAVGGRMVPYIPRHTLALGATWATTWASQRLYLSGRAVYRSERFEDQENLTRRPPGWGFDLMGFWESQDKRWIVGLAALNLLTHKTERQKARTILDARYRF